MPAQRPGRSVQEVRTPANFLAAVKRRLEIEAFTVDLAASRSNTVAKQFYSERSNALVQPWCFNGWGYCNPPYADLRPWVQKAYEESRLGARTAMLVPAGVGSNWWRDHVHSKARVLLLNGRITFVGHKQPYPKDCALLLYEPDGIPAYESWTWQDELKAAASPDLTSRAFDADLHLEPESCIIQLMTDEAGAEAIAAGILPAYIKQQARDNLALVNRADTEQKTA